MLPVATITPLTHIVAVPLSALRMPRMTRVADGAGSPLRPSSANASMSTPSTHASTWKPTPANAKSTSANASSPRLPPVDSVDVWSLLSGATDASPRVEIPVSPRVLLEFDDEGRAGGAIWKLMVGQFSRAGWQGPTYPNASSPTSDPDSVNHDCGAGCLFEVRSDPTEHNDLAAAQPDRVAAMAARLAALGTGMFSNNDTGVDLCPPGTPGDCACWMAANVYDGTLGPWQR